MTEHSLSWWGDGWWCSCGSIGLIDDLRARQHYDAIQQAAHAEMLRVHQALIAERGVLKG